MLLKIGLDGQEDDSQASVFLYRRLVNGGRKEEVLWMSRWSKIVAVKEEGTSLKEPVGKAQWKEVQNWEEEDRSGCQSCVNSLCFWLSTTLLMLEKGEARETSRWRGPAFHRLTPSSTDACGILEILAFFLLDDGRM